jgi:hypothetical protein
MTRLYQYLVIITLVVCAYVLGILTGFTTGYNDKMVEEIAKYRVVKRLTWNLK